jgi:hypothetical protein
MHVSQLEFHKNVYGSGEYSAAKYGLAFSAVGLDEAKDDFFEHIDAARLTTYVMPVETVVSTQTPVLAATPEPTASPAPTPEPEDATARNAYPPITIVLAAFLAVAAPLTVLAIVRNNKKHDTGV